MKYNRVVKWAGGKYRLLDKILKKINKKREDKFKFYELFVGGGSIALGVAEKYPNAEIYINDINPYLINVYKVLASLEKIDNMLEYLADWEDEYNSALVMGDIGASKQIFYNKRVEFNAAIKESSSEDFYLAALFVFLNKTGFNGLYRENKSGEFNGSAGSFDRPLVICDSPKYYFLNKIISKFKGIDCCDFRTYDKYTYNNSIYYFDPVYIPLNRTSKFTQYTKNGFILTDHIDLKNICDDINKKGGVFIASNSFTPIVANLYSDYNLEAVKMNRSINSDSNKRSKISEYFISNVQ